MSSSKLSRGQHIVSVEVALGDITVYPFQSTPKTVVSGKSQAKRNAVFGSPPSNVYGNYSVQVTATSKLW